MLPGYRAVVGVQLAELARKLGVSRQTAWLALRGLGGSQRVHDAIAEECNAELKWAGAPESHRAQPLDRSGAKPGAPEKEWRRLEERDETC